MNIANATFTAIDFESAGAQPGKTDVPVQIGMATMVGRHLREDTLFCSYLKADQPITWSARKVHGISDEDIAGAPTFTTLWPTVKNALAERVVVAHGAGTEKRFLRAFPFHGFGPWVDTLKVAHAVWPDAPRHSLEALIEMVDLKAEVDVLCPERRWHDALYDAVASLVLLRFAISECDLDGSPLQTLVDPDRTPYFANRAARLSIAAAQNE
ncbi:MAG: DNA polymerase-3 subunit epsilon [Verrucomicrobiales bacterium]|jgi:DNA polymerase-3 subunit epsilon